MGKLGHINFADVETFEAIGAGRYVGHVAYIRFRAASQAGKSDSLSVCLEADEGESKGEKSWQNLYFSDKSLWRMAKFFGIFGITDVDFDAGLSDEEPFDLLDPDLTGEPVVFEVKPDGTYNGQPSFKTEVVEWLSAKPDPRSRRKAAAAVEPEPEETEDETEEEAPARPAKSFAAKTTAAPRRPIR